MDTPIASAPAWVDLAADDVAAAGAFYGRLLGWDVQVSPDPQYGGYAIAQVGGHDAAGIGPKQSPGQPSAWSLYIGTSDADALSTRVTGAGGTVVSAAFDVGDQGRMAVFQDPAGAFISAWQSKAMSGFERGGVGAYAWAELNARGLERAIPFYEHVFGWTHRTSPMGEGQPDYTEFLLGDRSIGGGWEMNPAVPAEVPSYWLVYFAVEDVDASDRAVREAGGSEIVAPQDFPGGRFAIVADPEGARFGLLRMDPR